MHVCQNTALLKMEVAQPCISIGTIANLLSSILTFTDMSQ